MHCPEGTVSVANYPKGIVILQKCIKTATGTSLSTSELVNIIDNIAHSIDLLYIYIRCIKIISNNWLIRKRYILDTVFYYS